MRRFIMIFATLLAVSAWATSPVFKGGVVVSIEAGKRVLVVDDAVIADAVVRGTFAGTVGDREVAGIVNGEFDYPEKPDTGVTAHTVLAPGWDGTPHTLRFEHLAALAEAGARVRAGAAGCVTPFLEELPSTSGSLKRLTRIYQRFILFHESKPCRKSGLPLGVRVNHEHTGED